MKDRLLEMLYRMLGEADDQQQAQHLDLFAEAIQDACRLNHDNQYYYIAKHLGPKGAEMVASLAKYVQQRKDQQQIEGGA
jgi:hypothetical protein